MAQNILFICSLVLFSSSAVYAKSQIRSEFLIQMPLGFTQQLISKKWQELKTNQFQAQWTLPDQTVQSQQIPVQIRNIQLEVSTQLQEPQTQPDENIFRLSSQNLQAQLRLGEVKIDHVIEREVGGVIGRFRVQALCQNVTLNLAPNSGFIQMDLAPVIDEKKISTRLVDFNVQWSGAWTSPGFSCSGAKGFEDLVRTAVAGVANNWQSFLANSKSQLMEYTQKYLSNYQIEFAETIEVPVPGRKDLDLTFELDQIEDIGSGFQIKGHLTVLYSKGSKRLNLKLPSLDLPAIQGDQASFHLPQDLPKALLTVFLQPKSWHTRLNTKDFPAFEPLMDSRIRQLFVWPALMDFAKNTDFVFDLFSTKDFQWKGSGLNYNFTGTVNAWMQGVRENKYQRFMYFQLPVSARTKIRFSENKLSLELSHAKMNLKPYWDQEYVRRYYPNTYFDKNRIEKAVNEGLESEKRSFSVRLPKIPLTQGVNLSLKKAGISKKQTLELELEVQ